MRGQGADTLHLLPELLVLLGALGSLIGGSFLPRQRQWVARLGAVGALLAAAAASVVGLVAAPLTVFDGSLAVDTTTGVGRLTVLASVLLVIGLGVDELGGHRQERARPTPCCC